MRKSGDKVRITAQLDPRRRQLAPVVADLRPQADDIFAIQDEIAADVVKQLKVTLLGLHRRAKPTRRPMRCTCRPASSVSRHRRVLEAVRCAVPAGAGDRSALYAGLGGLARIPTSTKASTRGATDEGLPAGERGCRARRWRSTRSYAPAHARLGSDREVLDSDLAAAARHLERALALDPSDLDILGTAPSCSDVGRLQQAIASASTSSTRDPVNVRGHVTLATLPLCRPLRRGDRRVPHRAEPEPGIDRRAQRHRRCAAAQGRCDGALAENRAGTRRGQPMIGLAMAYHALGQKAESDAALDEADRKVREGCGLYNVAYVFAFRGERGRGLRVAGQGGQSSMTAFSGRSISTPCSPTSTC